MKNINIENHNVNEWLEVLSEASKGKEYSAFYKRLIWLVKAPSRKRSAVNVYKLNKYTKQGDTVVVPRKILSAGTIDHKINIAALDYSEGARKELSKAGCKIMTIREIVGQKKINIIV